jgi:hypothetical protein
MLKQGGRKRNNAKVRRMTNNATPKAIKIIFK